jgi:hypothetical protein
MWWKTHNFFPRKLEKFNKQKQVSAKITTSTSKPLLASFKLAYRTTKCETPHSIGECLVLPAATNTVETVLVESYAKQVSNISLANNNVGRIILDTSEDFVIN